MEERQIYFKNRKEWRAWLEKYHDKESKIALLVYKKHTGKPSMSHKESMEEAICFGWIDTTIKRLDEDTYIRRFSKRTKNSKWSTNTLSYGKKLIEEGKMSPAGLRFYEEGLKKPTLDHGIAKNPGVPDDLKHELEKDKIANANFEKFAPSYKRMYLRWLERAKMPETRRKRIVEIVRKASINHKNWN